MQSPFTLANQLYAKGDFERAHALYSQLLADTPKSLAVLLNRSACRVRLKDFAGAHADACFALQLDPCSAKARFRLGMANRHCAWPLLAAVQFRVAALLDDGVQEYRDAAAALAEVHPEAEATALHEFAMLPPSRRRAAKPMPPPRAVPVTLLSGFLGSGKTTLVERILAETTGLRIAVVVNDMAEVNVDAERVSSRTSDVVALSNGCICCTLRDDLQRELFDLAASSRFDAIVVESSGISEPLPVALAFSFQSLHGVTLNSVARLDCAVTVMDASAVLAHLGSTARLGAHDPRALANLIVDQIEFANVVVLNKTDLLRCNDDAERVSAVVRGLNPEAKIITAVRCTGFALSEVLLSGAFDMARASTSARWRRELRALEHVSEQERFGLQSAIVRCARPLLASVVGAAVLRNPAAWLARFNVLRSKGVWFVREADALALDWSSAGPTLQTSVAGRWKPGVGGARVEIVFIGVDLDADGLRAQFTAWEAGDDDDAGAQAGVGDEMLTVLRGYM